MNILEALVCVSECCPDNYAKSYARIALAMRPDDEALPTQLLYVKSNLRYWRGDMARDAKAAIDEAIGRMH